MRVLGLPIEPPQAVLGRLLNDVGAVARLAQALPDQFDRMLELGEEIAQIGREVLFVAQRLDQRAEAIMALGERLDVRAAELLELGDAMRDLGDRIDMRGAEIVDRAGQVVETGAELIAVLPAFERALEMATPLEGAIDRFGRLVDRLPGGATRRRPAPGGVPDAPGGVDPAAPDGPIRDDARQRSTIRRLDPPGPVGPAASSRALTARPGRSLREVAEPGAHAVAEVRAGCDQPAGVLKIVRAADRERARDPASR